MCFGHTTKGEKENLVLLYFLVDTITFKTFQIIFLLNTNIPHLLSTVRLCSPYREPKQPVWIAISAPVYVHLIVVSSTNLFSTAPLAKLTRNPELNPLLIIVLHLVTLVLRKTLDKIMLD